MAEYIERENLLKRFNIDDMMNVNRTLISLREARDTISNFPAADVAPVRRGLWKPVHESEATGWNPEFAGRDPIYGYICSECGTEAIYDCNDEHVLSAYCPHCGAKMDGAE